MRTIVISLCLIALFVNVASAVDTTTYYLDGTLVQRDVAAVKGIINLPLASNMIEQTLTVVPALGTSILGVEIYKQDNTKTDHKTVEALAEKRLKLQDRLQALETREAIFTAAAKSQSGKAPRKTKSNPDPMQSIRQGTDFAIAQLEAVYTARRRTNQEIKKIDEELAVANKKQRSSESAVKINVTPSRGKVTLRYATANIGWQPSYNLLLNDNGLSTLQLFAHIKKPAETFSSKIAAGSLYEKNSLEIFSKFSNGVVLKSYILPITEENYDLTGIFKRYSGKVTNNSGKYLPAGESALYKNNIYLGKFHFEGMSSGRNRIITLGK